MVRHKRFVAVSDWRIEVKDIVEVSFLIKLGGQRWTFYSPSLDYACYCIVPRAGVGLSFGASLPVDPGDMVNSLASNFLSADQDHVTIERPFSANSLDGASVGGFEVGARGVVAGADGHQIRVSNNAGHTIVRIRGGSVNLGLGVEVDMGSLTMGAFYGPYAMVSPRRGG
ncbi:MAG: hypothetical protein ACJAR9_002042 [Celeribacter sp.]|jgi:hypothetical protein